MKVVISRTGNFTINKEACQKLEITITSGSTPDFYGWCIRNKYNPNEFIWRTDYRLVQLVEEGKADFFRGKENVSNLVVIELPNEDICLNEWTIICTDYFGEVVKLLKSTNFVVIPRFNIGNTEYINLIKHNMTDIRYTNDLSNFSGISYEVYKTRR